MDISKQGVQDIEDREMDGRITLNVLRNVARAMEMELVYVLLPKAGSVEKLVEGKAEDLVFSADPRPFLEKMLAKEEYPQEFKRAVKLMIKKYPKELWD